MLNEHILTTGPASISNFEVKREDLPPFEDMPFEDIEELPLEHPGAKDPEYRKRRDFIASLAKKFRETGQITDVEYNEEEQSVWRHVAGELEELHQKKASPFYLESKKRFRHQQRTYSATHGNEQTSARNHRVSSRADRRTC